MPAWSNWVPPVPTVPPSPAACPVACWWLWLWHFCLFASRGGFSPELQLFTRGCTAALKRLAVILLEDAWVEAEDTPQQVAALLVLGLVTQRMHDYEPPRQLILAVLRLAAKAQRSKCIIAWRSEKDQKGAPCALFVDVGWQFFVESFSGNLDINKVVPMRLGFSGNGRKNN